MLNAVKKKVKRTLNTIGADHPVFRAGTRKVMHSYYWAHNKSDTFYLKTDSKTVIFASFEGRSYSDSPKALFEYMVQCGAFDGHTLIWGFKKGAPAREKELRDIAARLIASRTPAQKKRAQKVSGTSSGPKILSVRYNSVEWRRYQAQAKYWIYNFKVPDEIMPKEDQIFLQCWHGTPLKRLGFDLTHFDSATNTAAGIKKRYAAEAQKFNYFLTTCPYATEKFTSAWRLDEIGKTDCLLEIGYPRDDVLVNFTSDQVTEIKRRLFGAYYPEYEALCKKRRKIVLYCPTYRADEYEIGKGHTFRETIDFDRMRSEFGEEMIILFRAHYFVAGLFDFERYRGFVYNVSDWDDINDLYLISDAMITDYSSSMFDYAILKRPMVFYMYDLAHYRDASNGFYFDPHTELPGPIAESEDALFSALREAVSDAALNGEGSYWETYGAAYEAFDEKYNPYADGKAAVRTVQTLFRRNG